MIFLAINWLSLSITSLLFIFVIVCFLIGVVVLMQRPKQEGLGAAFGGGVTDQVFGARTTDVLQKATWTLGTIFFLVSFSLAILMAKQTAAKKKSLITDEKPVAEVVVPTPTPIVETPAPTTPSLASELPSSEGTPTTDASTPETPITDASTPETPATETPGPESSAPQENPSDKTE